MAPWPWPAIAVSSSHIEVLVRRFSQALRAHPMKRAQRVQDIIAADRVVARGDHQVEPVRRHARVLDIDREGPPPACPPQRARARTIDRS